MTLQPDVNRWLHKAAANAVCFLMLVAGAAGDTPPVRQRIGRLQRSLVAPCCWSQTVADHRSDVALQMRAEIAEFVAAGRSDREILDHYVRLYGARILIEPEGALSRWANSVPWAAFGIGLAAVLLVIIRMRRKPAIVGPPTAEAISIMPVEDP